MVDGSNINNLVRKVYKMICFVQFTGDFVGPLPPPVLDGPPVLGGTGILPWCGFGRCSVLGGGPRAGMAVGAVGSRGLCW